MLTSSVLNILGLQNPEPHLAKVEKRSPVQSFTVDDTPAHRQETILVRVQPPYPGMTRPLLPDLSLNPLDDPASKQRAFEEFLRALDEVDRVSRRPELDLFE